MSATFVDQPGVAYTHVALPIIVTITADAGHYDRVYLSLLDSRRIIIGDILRSSRRTQMDGTETFEWTDKWFRGLPTDQDYGFEVALCLNGNVVTRLQSSMIRLKRSFCKYRIVSFGHLY